MATAEMRYLREAAKEQARIYREHVKKLNRLRNDPYMDLDVKNKKMIELLASTRAQMDELNRNVQAKTAAIQSRVIAKTAPTDIARSDVRYMLSKQMGLHEICQHAIEQNRPELLASLREMVPMMAAARDLPGQGNSKPERALQNAMNTIESFEMRVATPQEQALYTERDEVKMGIGYLESNFKSISGNLSIHDRGGDVQLEQLYSWPGLVGDGQYKGNINLTTEGVA